MTDELICIEAELDVIEMFEMMRKGLVCVSYTKIGGNQDKKFKVLMDTPPKISPYYSCF